GIRHIGDRATAAADACMTGFLSRRLRAEVEERCTRVSVTNGGKIVYERSLAELHASSAPRYRLRTSDPAAARALLVAHEDARDVGLDGDDLLFTADEETVLELSRRIVEEGLGIAALVPETATLEHLFF